MGLCAQSQLHLPCVPMPLPPEDNPTAPETRDPRIDFGTCEFPSDSLSVKRLRTAFPELFEQGCLKDGFGHFFYPAGIAKPDHLVQLNTLLSAERTLVEYAFYRASEAFPGESLDEECHWCADQARRDLEQLYQQFKLADSLETARLLVQVVEEQGERQGKRVAGPRR